MISLYFAFNFALALTALVLRLTSRWRDLPAAQELGLHYWAMGFSVAVICVTPYLPQREKPIVRLWTSAALVQNLAPAATLAVAPWEPVSGGRAAWPLLLLIWPVAFVLNFARQIQKLRRLIKSSYRVKRIGRTHILFSPKIQIPLSFYLPGHAYVLLPARTPNLRACVAHELQHHRQGDTRWVYTLLALRHLCFFNPAVYLWSRWISQIQEFACDEALIDHGKVDAQAYTRCLIEVALTAAAVQNHSVCATGLIFDRKRDFLKRRIENMFKPRKPARAGKLILFALVAGLTTTAAALAGHGLVADRSVSFNEAREMAQRGRFPIVMNAAILKQLNDDLGTAPARRKMREALRRMQAYRALIEPKLKHAGLPEELMAVPIVESGYQNLPESNRVGVGAGIWSFIPTTARNYGLQVDEASDERLNATRETDAAVSYFAKLKKQMGDWPLAIMAYNMGEHALQEAIVDRGTRNPWTLIDQGVEGDRGYLAKVMAAVLILENPQAVE